MRLIGALLLSTLLTSCGWVENIWDRKQQPLPQGEEFIPVLSGNTEADIEKYMLDSVEKAEIVVPPGSATTVAQLSGTAVFSLLRTPSVGNFAEGNIDNVLVITLKTLNVPNRTLVPFEITGITVDDIQAMILNGASVPPAVSGYFDLGAQGASGYANLAIIFKSDSTTEGSETMTLRLISPTLSLSTAVTAMIEDTSRAPLPPVRPQPTYTLNKIPNTSVNEGNVSRPLTILLNTVGVDEGSTVPWTITGIDVDDIESMTVNGIPQAPALGGSFIVGGQGSAGMVLIFKADNRTEGLETMILGLPTVDGTPTISVQINDTSTTPPVPPPPVLVYNLTRTPATGVIPEGNTAGVLSIRLTTENVPAGTNIPWTLSGTGFTAADIETMSVNGVTVTPATSGTFVVGGIAPNYTALDLVFKNDATTEGDETVTFQLTGLSGVAPVQFVIGDTSTTPPNDTIPPMIVVSSALSTVNDSIVIGGTAADNVGIVAVQWVNRTAATNGTATLISYGNVVSWTATIPLVIGNNELEFTAFDARGLTAVASYSAAGPQPPPPPAPVDATPPDLQITEQSGMDSTGVITIYGVATDNDRVDTLVWSNSLGGSGSATGLNNTGNTTWFANITLKTGTNIITFTARDRAANSAAIVVSVDGTVGSGQTSYEGPQNVPTGETPVNPAAIDDAQFERLQRELQERQRQDYEREMHRMRERIERENTVRTYGQTTNTAINLSALRIPGPPAEVHPCNRGYAVQWGEAPIHMQPNFGRFESWRLLASNALLDASIMQNGMQSVNTNVETETVQFYWIRILTDNIMGVYDTGVRTTNHYGLGSLDVKLNLGAFATPYEFVTRAYFSALPPSTMEPCAS